MARPTNAMSPHTVESSLLQSKHGAGPPLRSGFERAASCFDRNPARRPPGCVTESESSPPTAGAKPLAESRAYFRRSEARNIRDLRIREAAGRSKHIRMILIQELWHGEFTATVRCSVSAERIYAIS